MAAALVRRLAAAPEIATPETDGPGFVNLRLKPKAFRARLPAILAAGEVLRCATTTRDEIASGAALACEYHPHVRSRM
jgi:arginyl-tRNA synthetase